MSQSERTLPGSREVCSKQLSFLLKEGQAGVEAVSSCTQSLSNERPHSEPEFMVLEVLSHSRIHTSRKCD